MIPAMRAAASTSPFLAVPSTTAAKASADSVIVASALASRSVTALSDTSTIPRRAVLVQMRQLGHALRA